VVRHGIEGAASPRLMFAPVVFGHLPRVVRLHVTVAATGI
jgi:hypothetical protein